jgi:dTDP-4-amino-4,6-dideoxygalactose transaminase
LDEIQAAFLRVKLPHLDSWNARRNAIAKLYQSTIKHPHVTLPPVGEKDFVAHLFVIRCEQRDSLVAHLRSKSVPHDIHFPVPDHLQPMFDGRFSASAVPVTERLCKEVLTLPCFPEMTDEEVNWVAAAVNDWRT